MFSRIVVFIFFVWVLIMVAYLFSAVILFVKWLIKRIYTKTGW